MSQATLMCRHLVLAVDDVAVTHERAVVVVSHEERRIIKAAVVGDLVGGGDPARRNPEPGPLAPYPPAGLVHRHVPCRDDGVLDRLLGRGSALPVVSAARARAPRVITIPKRARRRETFSNESPRP